jgi:hypothetical protein
MRMTTDGGTNPGTYAEWQQARIALGGVAGVFQQRADADPELFNRYLREVPDYELIPLRVREALEGLDVRERQGVNSILTVLAENNFYLENGIGALVRY